MHSYTKDEQVSIEIVNIAKNRIVTIAMQIKTVAAMFLDEPSGVSGQYGTVAKRVGNKIFKTADKEIIYYVSSLALYKIQNLFRTHKIDQKYRRARYHAMMLFRMLVSTEEMPRFNARKMETYCKNILEVLENDSECERIFSGIVSYIASKDYDLDIAIVNVLKEETTEYLKSRIDEIKMFVDTYSISNQ